MEIVRAALQIIRPYSSLLAFLSILIPVFSRTNDLSLSLRRAVPLLLASMCTFIINDLNDVEKDRINHPERPLPSGQVKPTFAAVFYFICLGATLLATHFWIEADHISFLYYLLLVLSISYSYVVEYLPSIKPVYVACASSVPVVILAAYYPQEPSLYGVAVAFFFFLFGRELCKDLLDRPGDPVSFFHSFEPTRLALFAFVSQAAGLILLSLQIEDLVGLLDILAMTVLFAISYICWFRRGRLAIATALMKAIVFCGLYFLI